MQRLENRGTYIKYRGKGYTEHLHIQIQVYTWTWSIYYSIVYYEKGYTEHVHIQIQVYTWTWSIYYILHIHKRVFCEFCEYVVTWSIYYAVLWICSILHIHKRGHSVFVCVWHTTYSQNRTYCVCEIDIVKQDILCLWNRYSSIS